MDAQAKVWNQLEDHYFRLEIGGWERLPDAPSLLVGIHSGGALTMDAWTLVGAWWRHFGEHRILHGTAHDGLMAAPGLGHYMRLAGVVPARREPIEAALAAGHDVIVWPGGEVDAMRSWRKRDDVVLGGRKGFPATAGKLIAVAHVLLLGLKQLLASRQPLLSRSHVLGHRAFSFVIRRVGRI